MHQGQTWETLLTGEETQSRGHPPGGLLTSAAVSQVFAGPRLDLGHDFKKATQYLLEKWS